MNPIEQIKNRLSILDVVSTYVRVEKSGNQFKARCPFHNEKTASFYISQEYNNFHCFGCGKAGDIFSFIEEIEHIPFREALELLGERAGVDIKSQGQQNDISLLSVLEESKNYYSQNLQSSTSAQIYLDNRGINKETIEDFGIGYASNEWRGLANYLQKKNISLESAKEAGVVIQTEKGFYDRWRGRLMFPIANSSGKVIGFSGRILPEFENLDGRINAKYVNSPETPLFHKSKILFGLDKAKKYITTENMVVVVEGQVDVILSHQIAVKHVVGVSGTALTEEQLLLLKRYTSNIAFCFDTDKAGKEALLRSAKIALILGFEVFVIYTENSKDPAELIQLDKNLWHEAIKNKSELFLFLIERILEQKLERNKLPGVIQNLIFSNLVYVQSNVARDIVLEKVSHSLGLDVQSLKSDFDNYYRKQDESSQKVVQTTDSKKDSIDKVERLYIDYLALSKHLTVDKRRQDIIDTFIKNYTFKIPQEETLDKSYLSRKIFETENLKMDENKLDTLLQQTLKRLEIAIIESTIEESRQRSIIGGSNEKELELQFSLAKKRDLLKQQL